MSFFDARTGQFVAFLKSKASITALVGAADNARIYPDRAKQGVTGTYLVYIIASGESYLYHAGFHNLREFVVHLYAFASVDTVANDLAEKVNVALRELQRVTLGEPTSGQVWVESCFPTIVDGGTEAVPGSDLHRYWRRLVITLVLSPI